MLSNETDSMSVELNTKERKDCGDVPTMYYPLPGFPGLEAGWGVGGGRGEGVGILEWRSTRKEKNHSWGRLLSVPLESSERCALPPTRSGPLSSAWLMAIISVSSSLPDAPYKTHTASSIYLLVDLSKLLTVTDYILSPLYPRTLSRVSQAQSRPSVNEVSERMLTECGLKLYESDLMAKSVSHTEELISSKVSKEKVG